MGQNIELRKIDFKEIPLIKDFPPKEWQLDLSKVFAFHFGEKYFYPVVALIHNKIIGTGIAMLNNDIGWLGTIVVKEEYRNRGIGFEITGHLVHWVIQNRGKKILLCATEQGLNVYRKLGFEVSSNYTFYKKQNGNFSTDLQSIQNIYKNDLDSILSLDKKATGEERNRVIEKTFITGFKYTKNGKLTGYYLPDFGRGLVIAEDKISGIELIKFKYMKEKEPVVVPESNTEAIGFLKQEGFEASLKVPRMFFGDEPAWKPEMIFCRGCGYMG